MASLTESAPPKDIPPKREEDSEEIELEEAQAEAEAMLDAEARGNGTVDARAEVRAPAKRPDTPSARSARAPQRWRV